MPPAVLVFNADTVQHAQRIANQIAHANHIAEAERHADTAHIASAEHIASVEAADLLRVSDADVIRQDLARRGLYGAQQRQQPLA